MPQYFSPGVYVEEVDSGPRPIQGVSTSVAGAVGVTLRGPVNGKPVLVTSFPEFQRIFGGFIPEPKNAEIIKWDDKNGQRGVWWRFPNAVRGFFDNGGQQLYVKRVVSSDAKPASNLLKHGGIIAEIVGDSDADESVVRVRHAIGIGASIVVVNGITKSEIANSPVTSFDLTEGNATIRLSSPLGTEVSAARGDFIRLKTPTAAPLDAILIKGNSPGEWSNSLEVQVLPHVGATLRLRTHDSLTEDAAKTAFGRLAIESKVIGGTRKINLNDDHTLADTNVVRIRGRKYTLRNPDDIESEVQKISVSSISNPTGGFSIKFNGTIGATPATATASAITAAEIEAAIVSAGVNSADINVAGDLPGETTIAFQAGLAGARQPQIEIVSNTIGPDSPVVTVETHGGPKSFTVDAETEDDGQDWALDTPVQKLRAAKFGDATVFASGASRLYPKAMVEISNGKEKEFLTVKRVLGDQIEFSSEPSHGIHEDDRIFVIEAEVTARLVENGRAVQQEQFSNLKLDSDDKETDPSFIVNHINRRSELIEVSTSGTNLVATGLDTFPGTGTPGFIKLEKGDNALASLSSNNFVGIDGGSGNRTGIKSLEDIEDISIVMVPGLWARSVVGELLRHCDAMKYRMAILDSPHDSQIQEIREYRAQFDSKRAALYYPWIKSRQPGVEDDIVIPPSGHVAGIYASVDTRRGYHKAPANEIVRGITEINQDVNKREQDLLNPNGINALRFFPGRGNRVWGARTISSDTNFKYVNVRRTFNFIERSIDEGTQFVVFEPNNPELWSRVRQTVGNFLNTQWRNGALEGKTPDEAFFVACDRGTTMTQDDIENGRLIVEVGIAPVFPAEFVIFKIQKFTADSKLA